ncbi:MAG: hypothetical protein PHS60_02400 [Zavarzinia sp.]|nr:hypothetical protein [Zavarzinia sp.]
MSDRDDAFYIIQNLSSPFALMRFHLVYRGPLRATQSKRSHSKDARVEIRKQITPQIEKLWDVSGALHRLQWDARVPSPEKAGNFMSVTKSPLDPWYNAPPQYEPQAGFVDLTSPIVRHGKSFRPLVRKSLDLTCSLDILFLRQEDPGDLLKKAGDLDNRIKTFIDALEMPSRDSDPAGDGDEVEGMNYRLLEDDTLVRGINIDSERLLLPDTTYPNEVHLVAEVTVHVERVGPWNVSLLGP